MRIYRLRLNSFEKNVKASWEELQMDTDFCDVILACEDKKFKTHTTVISSCSPVLRNILKINQKSNILIYLMRVNHRDLQNLITFMYEGVVDVEEQDQDLPSFLEVAEDLQIRGLSEANPDRLNLENTTDVNHYDQYPGSNTYNRINDKTSSDPVSSFTKFLEVTKQLDKKFFISGGLQKHKQSIHMVVQYSCEKCEYKGKQKSDLKRHVESFHDGVRYSCEI